MRGEIIYARSLSSALVSDAFGNQWQYHPRSDIHSKIISWCILFDLLDSCELLHEHVRKNKIGFGINHEMHDYQNNRKKNLDMVICTPASGKYLGGEDDFLELYKKYDIALTHQELSDLQLMGGIKRCVVGTSLIAIEAKACMTEHGKARPRLYDELASSFQVINGDTNSSIAAGHISINVASSFISPLRNKKNLKESEAEITYHKKQPLEAKAVFEKVKQLPRRSAPNDAGYDAIGVSILTLRNDGSPVSIGSDFGDGSKVDSKFTYDLFIERLSTIYKSRFASL